MTTPSTNAAPPRPKSTTWASVAVYRRWPATVIAPKVMIPVRSTSLIARLAVLDGEEDGERGGRQARGGRTLGTRRFARTLKAIQGTKLRNIFLLFMTGPSCSAEVRPPFVAQHQSQRDQHCAPWKKTPVLHQALRNGSRAGSARPRWKVGSNRCAGSTRGGRRPSAPSAAAPRDWRFVPGRTGHFGE